MSKETHDYIEASEINENIKPILYKAFISTGSEIRYWLEQLPMSMNSDYDVEVHEIIKELEAYARNQDEDAFKYQVNRLLEHYEANQDDYEI